MCVPPFLEAEAIYGKSMPIQLCNISPIFLLSMETFVFYVLSFLPIYSPTADLRLWLCHMASTFHVPTTRAHSITPFLSPTMAGTYLIVKWLHSNHIIKYLHSTSILQLQTTSGAFSVNKSLQPERGNKLPGGWLCYFLNYWPPLLFSPGLHVKQELKCSQMRQRLASKHFACQARAVVAAIQSDLGYPWQIASPRAWEIYSHLLFLGWWSETDFRVYWLC